MIGDSDERNMCYRHMYQRADIVDGQDSVLEPCGIEGLQTIICMDS